MKLKLNRFASERAFRSPSDFANYAGQQAAKFEALQRTNTAASQTWANRIAEHWRGAERTGKSAGADGAKLQEHLDRHPVFPFDSALTRQLLQMIEQGRQTGAEQVFPFLTGNQEGQVAHNYRLGQILGHADLRMAAMFDQHVRASPQVPIDRMMADHEQRLHAMLKADKEEIDRLRSEFDVLVEETKRKQERLHEWARALLLGASADWETTYAQFMEHLGTETAVELWKDRAGKHELRYKSFRKWAIGFGVVGLVATILWIFGGFAIARAVFEDDKTAQLASYTAGSLAMFTLFVWGLRVLIRSMMSEDHLSTDASARSALAHTYLALTKEQAATAEDRAIILAALFAPVSDGLVRDDGMPALSPAALAAQMVTNPRT